MDKPPRISTYSGTPYATYKADEMDAYIAELHAELVEALKYCKRWHQGDKWRYAKPGCDRYEEFAWHTHMKRINDALAKAGIN